MKIFYDTEFLEGTQDKRFLGIKYGKTKPTIDLISISLVAEDDREYYAISKDFNLKEAWNRWDGEYHEQRMFEKQNGFSPRKKYWIRENVLKPIWTDLLIENWLDIEIKDEDFNYKNLKKLIKKYGKTNKQISYEILQFTLDPQNIGYNDWLGSTDEYYDILKSSSEENIELYGYYSDYDHTVLCWLFGKMIDLPKGFPMYTIDLKQILDEKQQRKRKNLKEYVDYPKQVGEHNALQDARWNKKLYEFLQKK